MQELFDAVEKNEIALVQKFIANGVNINAKDKGGSTPLMRASLHCSIELVEVLINSGADVNTHDGSGCTALHYAAQENCEAVVQKLIEANANINAQDVHGNSPLNNAVFSSRGKGDMIKLLRQLGADDNQPNKYGVTPLQLAKMIANYDIIQFFKN